MLKTEQAGAVRILTIDRADKMNAFAPGLIALVEAALDEALADEATRVVVITGAGNRAFVAGNDVAALAALDPVGAYRDMQAGQRLMKRLHEFEKPTIAMVNGYALGGGFELALACDFVISSTEARFGFPEISLDTMPGWGGTQLAVLKLGLARAKELVLSGRHHSADACRGYGFVTRIVAPEALREATLDFAATLARRHPFALEMAKRALNRAAEMPLQAGLDLEAATYALNFGTPHARAGLQNFLNK
ncbi:MULTISPECIES: enoyl-CoA hydratase/isomerase family protein [Cupriavidus]|uniref:Short-chain-enoyl-CoA hydratase n=2 Tax=Cupriavidus TaxID=106589 RepID=A0ABM8XY27_9BURK|nr:MULTISPECIES: enoyl-CoA hydratase/isomerase family protein [Cupriavidus]CAG9166329.1 Short-chain-enoyl-CoA hydratase [Cupriavidus pinatubonensis]CAG9185355.1 Short-chain-enoyl-CoA hydratase [Cupriavidus laharis]